MWLWEFQNTKSGIYEKLNFFLCFCHQCKVSVFYINEFVLKVPFVCCMYRKRRLYRCKMRERKQLPECVDKMTQLDSRIATMTQFQKHSWNEFFLMVQNNYERKEPYGNMVLIFHIKENFFVGSLWLTPFQCFLNLCHRGNGVWIMHQSCLLYSALHCLQSCIAAGFIRSLLSPAIFH